MTYEGQNRPKSGLLAVSTVRRKATVTGLVWRDYRYTAHSQFGTSTSARWGRFCRENKCRNRRASPVVFGASWHGCSPPRGSGCTAEATPKVEIKDSITATHFAEECCSFGGETNRLGGWCQPPFHGPCLSSSAQMSAQSRPRSTAAAVHQLNGRRRVGLYRIEAAVAVYVLDGCGADQVALLRLVRLASVEAVGQRNSDSALPSCLA